MVDVGLGFPKWKPEIVRRKDKLTRVAILYVACMHANFLFTINPARAFVLCCQVFGIGVTVHVPQLRFQTRAGPTPLQWIPNYSYHLFFTIFNLYFHYVLYPHYYFSIIKSGINLLIKDYNCNVSLCPPCTIVDDD